MVTGTRTITGSAGDVVTLLALGGEAGGVTTNGLLYPLHRETIPFGSARGLSNVMLATAASAQGTADDAYFDNLLQLEGKEPLPLDELKAINGVGETLACGSGACAAAAILMRRGRVDRDVTVSLPGGDLRIAWPGDTAPVSMAGPATFVFEGEWLP